MLKNIEYRKLFLIVGLIWIVGFLIATLATPDVISSSNVLSSFCKLVGCKSWMKNSDFPEISTLYFWVIWISLPFWICVYWKWLWSQVESGKAGLLFKRKLFIKHRLIILFITPLWFFLFYAAIFLYSGEDSRLFRIGTSRIHLALWGMVLPLAAGATFSIGVFSVKRIFSLKE